MTELVLDASAAAAILLPDEDSEKIVHSLSEFQKNHPGKLFHVPSLWWFELSNILLVAQRRGRIKEEDLQIAFSILARLPVETDFCQGTRYQNLLVAIAQKEGLTAYDASYIELAERKKAGLLTIDKGLEKIRKKRKIPK